MHGEFFGVGAAIPDIECLNCGKPKECVTVTCKAGTFSGPLCQTCLFREAKKRTANAVKKGQPAPDNGQPVTP